MILTPDAEQWFRDQCGRTSGTRFRLLVDAPNRNQLEVNVFALEVEESDDHVLSFGEGELRVDPVSWLYLKGTSLDTSPEKGKGLLLRDMPTIGPGDQLEEIELKWIEED